MKKVTKSLLSILLVCLMLFSAATAAFASDGVSAEKVSTYEVQTKTGKVADDFKYVMSVCVAVVTLPLWLPFTVVFFASLGGDDAKADKWLDILLTLNPWLLPFVTK